MVLEEGMEGGVGRGAPLGDQKQGVSRTVVERGRGGKGFELEEEPLAGAREESVGKMTFLLPAPCRDKEKRGSDNLESWPQTQKLPSHSLAQDRHQYKDRL